MKAAIYARISADPDQEEKGVTDQVKDAEKLAADLGWTVVRRFVENDTSAFKKRRVMIEGEWRHRVVRPLFSDLLAEARAGRVRGIVVNDLDRMVREPRDLEDLIELVEDHGIEVRSVTGTLNLTSGGDVTMARVLVAVANKSSRDTSRRVKRAILRNAEAGRAHGGRRTFGFEVVPGPILENGKRGPSRYVQVEAEAEAIREAIDAVLAGSSIYSIARRWDAAGLKRVYGGTWADATGKVTQTLVTWKNAGVVSLKGERLEGVEASWPAIVSVEKLEAVRAVLLDPARRVNGGHPARRSSVSGLVKCGSCGAPLRSTTHSGSRKLDPKRKVGRVQAYRCSGAGCGMTIRAHRVDPLVGEAVVAELLCRDLAALAPDPADGARMAELRVELAEVAVARSAVYSALAARPQDAGAAAGALDGLDARQRAAQAELGGIARRFASAAFLQDAAVDLLALPDAEVDGRAEAVMAKFEALDLGQRRAIVEELVEVTVHSGQGPDRVRVFSRSTGEQIHLGWSSTVSFTNLTDEDLKA